MSEYYTRGEKEYLLKIARQTLEKFVMEREKLEPQTVNQKMWEKRGVFITLRKGKQLRGCVGVIEPLDSVLLAVRDNTIAASRDTRFLPVLPEELQNINIEISILSKPEVIKFSEINKGDGVVLEYKEKKATFLPQVWNDLSDKDKFMNALCIKAGLDGNHYKNDKAEFKCYKTIVFDEGE